MNSITINGIEIKYLNKEKHFEQVAYGTWEPETFKVMDEYCRPGNVFLDIGAWVGTLSIYASKKGCEVVAVEPDLIARKMWWDNVTANDIKECQLIPSAIVDDPNRPVTIYSHDEFGDSMSTIVRQSDKGMECTVTTLPTILSFSHKPYCLIKIDIEGAESLIMNDRSLAALIEANLPPILLCLHPAFIECYEEWFLNFSNLYSEHYEIEQIAHDTILLK